MTNPFFPETGFIIRGVLNLTPKEAYRMCNSGAILIDVRENYHSFLHTFDVTFLFYCPRSELLLHLDKIPHDVPVIIADAAGLKSLEALQLLREKGFTNIANLAGGMLEWNREQMPVRSDKTQRLSGSCICMLKYREIKRPVFPDFDPEKSAHRQAPDQTYPMKILILCTGNSCRSQMAQGFLQSFSDKLEVCSAGTSPAEKVHPLAVRVMGEKGIDLSGYYPKSVDLFLDQAFDYVITVCEGARESCPVFTGKVKYRLHIGFEDPVSATGTEEEVLMVFRKIRDEIEDGFREFYKKSGIGI